MISTPTTGRGRAAALVISQLTVSGPDLWAFLGVGASRGQSEQRVNELHRAHRVVCPWSTHPNERKVSATAPKDQLMQVLLGARIGVVAAGGIPGAVGLGLVEKERLIK